MDIECVYIEFSMYYKMFFLLYNLLLFVVCNMSYIVFVLLYYYIFRQYGNKDQTSNDTYPDEITLTILNGSSNLSMDQIPDQDIIIDNNCIELSYIKLE